MNKSVFGISAMLILFLGFVILPNVNALPPPEGMMSKGKTTNPAYVPNLPPASNKFQEPTKQIGSSSKSTTSFWGKFTQKIVSPIKASPIAIKAFTKSFSGGKSGSGSSGRK